MTCLSRQGYKLKKEDLSNEHRSKIIKELNIIKTTLRYLNFVLENSFNIIAVKINITQFTPAKYLNCGKTLSDRANNNIGSKIKKKIMRIFFLDLIFLFKNNKGNIIINKYIFFSDNIIILNELYISIIIDLRKRFI